MDPLQLIPLGVVLTAVGIVAIPVGAALIVPGIVGRVLIGKGATLVGGGAAMVGGGVLAVGGGIGIAAFGVISPVVDVVCFAPYHGYKAFKHRNRNKKNATTTTHFIQTVPNNDLEAPKKTKSETHFPALFKNNSSTQSSQSRVSSNVSDSSSDHQKASGFL